MEPLDGGHGCTRYALPVREVVGKLAVRYKRKKFATFNEMRCYENDFPQNAFP